MGRGLSSPPSFAPRLHPVYSVSFRKQVPLAWANATRGPARARTQLVADGTVLLRVAIVHGRHTI